MPGFMGSISLAAGGAGLFGNAVLWNPVGSGINGLVRVVSFLPSTSTTIGVGGCTVQPATAGSQGPKILGNAQGSLVMFGENNAAAVNHNIDASGIGLRLLMPGAGLNVYQLIGRPIIVPPGYGCGFFAQTANIALGMSVEWDEYPTTIPAAQW